jgi:hypothetical protein
MTMDKNPFSHAPADIEAACERKMVHRVTGTDTSLAFPGLSIKKYSVL